MGVLMFTEDSIGASRNPPTDWSAPTPEEMYEKIRSHGNGLEKYIPLLQNVEYGVRNILKQHHMIGKERELLDAPFFRGYNYYEYMTAKSISQLIKNEDSWIETGMVRDLINCFGGKLEIEGAALVKNTFKLAVKGIRIILPEHEPLYVPLGNMWEMKRRNT